MSNPKDATVSLLMYVVSVLSIANVWCGTEVRGPFSCQCAPDSKKKKRNSERMCSAYIFFSAVFSCPLSVTYSLFSDKIDTKWIFGLGQNRVYVCCVKRSKTRKHNEQSQKQKVQHGVECNVFGCSCAFILRLKSTEDLCNLN